MSRLIGVPRFFASLELLQKARFPFASGPGLTYPKGVPTCERTVFMIVCSCNVFSDHDVRKACSGSRAPRTPGQVYGCLGCSAQCGRCARTIKKIMDEALGACAKSCCAGCPHTAAEAGTAAEVIATTLREIEHAEAHASAASSDLVAQDAAA